jgi:sec-independent protein translocase protein TatA
MLNSPIEIAMVFGVALLVFGPKKLPELGRSLGLGIGNFKKSLQDAQDEVKNAMKTEPSPKNDEGASLQPAGGITESSKEVHTGSCCGGGSHSADR